MRSSLIVLCLALTFSVHSSSLPELLKMEDKLVGLAKLSTETTRLGDASINYVLDPNIYTFLRQFKTRTDFCDYKCDHFFNFPCFILFGCNIQSRNFLLLFLFPLLMLALTGLCCGKGIWTFSCWLKYLIVFTGVGFIIWVIKKCASGSDVRQRKENEVSKNQQQKESNHQPQVVEDELGAYISTCDRMRKSNSSKSSD